MHIKQFAAKAHELAKSKGWYSDEKTDDQRLESATNNMHNEVSELHEAWRNGKLYSFCDKAIKMAEKKIEPLSCFEEELADIFIRVCDTAEFFGIDIEYAVQRKHEYNKYRPIRHGGKKS